MAVLRVDFFCFFFFLKELITKSKRSTSGRKKLLCFPGMHGCNWHEPSGTVQGLEKALEKQSRGSDVKSYVFLWPKAAQIEPFDLI